MKTIYTSRFKFSQQPDIATEFAGLLDRGLATIEDKLVKFFSLSWWLDQPKHVRPRLTKQYVRNMQKSELKRINETNPVGVKEILDDPAINADTREYLKQRLEGTVA